VCFDFDFCYSPDGPLSSNRKVHFLNKKRRKREQFIFSGTLDKLVPLCSCGIFLIMKWKRPGHWVWSKVLPLDSPALHKEVPHFLASEASRSTLAHSKGVPNDTVGIIEQKYLV